MATLTADTVENVCQIISDLRGESSTNTDASRIRAVSRAERDYARRRFWRTHYLKNQTMSGDGGADYTIGSSTFPMRMKGLAEVFVGGTTEDKRYQIVDFNAFKNLYNRNNATQVVYEWYDATNDLWKVRINPVVPSGTTITYSYFWEPPKRTLTTDLVVCPNIKIIGLLALADIYDGEDESESADAKKQEAEQLIAELTGLENAPAQNQLIQIQPIESQIQSRGLGTY